MDKKIQIDISRIEIDYPTYKEPEFPQPPPSPRWVHMDGMTFIKVSNFPIATLPEKLMLFLFNRIRRTKSLGYRNQHWKLHCALLRLLFNKPL
jgi:hypothetical protein